MCETHFDAAPSSDFEDGLCGRSHLVPRFAHGCVHRVDLHHGAALVGEVAEMCGGLAQCSETHDGASCCDCVWGVLAIDGHGHRPGRRDPPVVSNDPQGESLPGEFEEPRAFRDFCPDCDAIFPSIGDFCFWSGWCAWA